MEETKTDLDLQSICSSATSTAPPSRSGSPAPSAPPSQAVSEAGDNDEDALAHFQSTFADTIGSLSVALVEARIEEDSPVLQRQQQLLRDFENAMLGVGQEAGNDDKASKVQGTSQVDKVENKSTEVALRGHISSLENALKVKEESMKTMQHDHEETIRRIHQGHEETIRKLIQDREETSRRLVSDISSLIREERLKAA